MEKNGEKTIEKTPPITFDIVTIESRYLTKSNFERLFPGLAWGYREIRVGFLTYIYFQPIGTEALVLSVRMLIPKTKRGFEKQKHTKTDKEEIKLPISFVKPAEEDGEIEI